MREFWARFDYGRVIVVVPTRTLLDQWSVALQDDLGLPSQEIACYSGEERPSRPAAANVVVINSGRRLVRELSRCEAAFLVVDECHRAGSPVNARALEGTFAATLGLSATPRRQYDRGFEEYVAPVLGPIIYEYGYREAVSDGIVVPFELHNVEVALLPQERLEYDRLTRRVGALSRASSTQGTEPALAARLERVLQMRASVSATARMRLPVAAKVLERHRGERSLVFHERVAAVRSLVRILEGRNHSVSAYHTGIAPDVRRDNLRLFRRGVYDVLVCCRALDEGMDVAEATVAVIASGSASERQRIQRLGRVLRTAKGKARARIYTLFATSQERRRLLREAEMLRDMADITWSVSGAKAE